MNVPSLALPEGKKKKTGKVGTGPLRETKGDEEVPRVLGSAWGHAGKYRSIHNH